MKSRNIRFNVKDGIMTVFNEESTPFASVNVKTLNKEQIKKLTEVMWMCYHQGRVDHILEITESYDNLDYP